MRTWRRSRSSGSTFRTRTSTAWVAAARASAASRARRRRWPTPCTTPRAAACGRCPSHPTSCWPERLVRAPHGFRRRDLPVASVEAQRPLDEEADALLERQRLELALAEALRL